MPPFSNLRSDYPLFFTSCNWIRQCRCAHVHRLLMSDRIASSGSRSRTARLVLGFRWHRKNHALCPKHGLSTAALHKFALPDAGPISLKYQTEAMFIYCASSPKRYVCTKFFALEFYLEDHHANVELPALELQAESCFDKRHVTYGSLNLGFMVRKLRSIVAQLIARCHELSEVSCARERCRNHRLNIKTKEEDYVSQ